MAEALGGAMVEVDEVVRTFGGEKRLLGGHAPAVHAVRGVSFRVMRGETLGIVGESGCGKSTLARMLVGLDKPTAGRIAIAGRDGAIDPAAGARVVARTAQYVFQDCVAALNPRKAVSRALDVPLRRLQHQSRGRRAERRAELMRLVNLDPSFLERYPHELSGGQAQRIGIARALAAEPDLLVLDEPVSALDVSMQAQVLALLAELKARLSLTYVFISHDLAVVEAESDRVAILYFGKVVEIGSVEDTFARPHHPYTELLLKSAPAPGRRIAVGEGEESELPDAYAPPPGCAFAPRCPRAGEICRKVEPPLQANSADQNHLSACHFPLLGEASLD